MTTPDSPSVRARPYAVPCRIRVSDEGGRLAVYASEPIARGEIVLHFVGREATQPSRHSIQTGWHTHMWGPDGLPPVMAVQEYGWRFLNHSCDPNAYVNGLTLVALAAIEEGAEITFDYNTTEWELAHPFACECGAESCVGKVAGFAHLDDVARRRIVPYLAEYLKGRGEPV